MTSDRVPASDSPGPGSPDAASPDAAPVPASAPGTAAPAAPELRASHADRDRVVEVLRVAAGDGRLTAEELDERLEAALNARTHGELAALTTDLPALAGQNAKDLVQITQRFGDAARIGRWVVPRRLEIQVTAGNVKLDFTEAIINHDTVEIDIDLGIGGDLLLVIKPGIVVDADDLKVIHGDVKIKNVTGPHAPLTLRVVMTGRIRGGDVVARLPYRSFGEWIRRRPHPYKSLPG